MAERIGHGGQQARLRSALTGERRIAEADGAVGMRSVARVER